MQLLDCKLHFCSMHMFYHHHYDDDDDGVNIGENGTKKKEEKDRNSPKAMEFD